MFEYEKQYEPTIIDRILSTVLGLTLTFGVGFSMFIMGGVMVLDGLEFGGWTVVAAAVFGSAYAAYLSLANLWK